MTALLAPDPRVLAGWTLDVAEIVNAVAVSLQARMRAVVCAGGGMGEMEVGIADVMREAQRQVLEKTAQARADAADSDRCPHCGEPLTRRSGGHELHVRSVFGEILVCRAKGYCPRCGQWQYPADAALGLEERAKASPGMQEAAALLVSKMPATEAARVLSHLTGVPVDDSTIQRDAQRAGERARELRRRMDEQACAPETRPDLTRAARQELPARPSTLVIEIDAWNIRERGQDWGRADELREAGQPPDGRWHWVYVGTVFRLDQRATTQSGRPMILSRTYVATRNGLEDFTQQLFAEAVRQGVMLRGDLLVVADGAPWIWNLVKDRFPWAQLRLDFFHAAEHLWELGSKLYGKESPERSELVRPLLHRLRHGEAAQVLDDLQALAKSESLSDALRSHAQDTADYFARQADRLTYAEGDARGEPLGSGAIESMCRQEQCRFKRPGQFWSDAGDESLLALEIFWRNDRWSLLFPHTLSLASRN